MSGTTNYNSNPSTPFTGSTTEFEDALMKHNVITKEQALLNKGMNSKSVTAFLKSEREGVERERNGGGKGEFFKRVEKVDDREDQEETEGRLKDAYLDTDDDDDDDDDDEFMNSYRTKRLQDLKISHEISTQAALELANRRQYGDVVEIQRPDWTREVNEASLNENWVIVTLTSSSIQECTLVLNAMEKLAVKFKYIKFLKIRSTSAIENWPDANLPAVFCYVNGEMHKQMIGETQLGGPGTTSDRVEWRLKALGVLKESILTGDGERGKMHIKNVDKLNVGLGERKGMDQHYTYDEEDDEEVYD